MSCYFKGVSNETQLTLRIVIHGSGSGMTFREAGRIIGARESGPGPLWEEPDRDGTGGARTLAFCKQIYLVSREYVALQERP